MAVLADLEVHHHCRRQPGCYLHLDFCFIQDFEICGGVHGA